MLPPKDQMEQMKREQEDRFKDPTTESRAVAFGPPSFDNNDSNVHDNDELEDTYSKFNDAPLEPEYEDDEDVNTEPESFGFTPPPEYRGASSAPRTESLRQEGGSFLREDEIFPGGPSRSELMSWKKQFEIDGHTINLSEIGEDIFIWRTLNRVEYREVMALPNTDPLQREEILAEVCTLFPYDYNFTTMANRKAGVPAILSEQIMKESGFQKVAPPVRL